MNKLIHTIVVFINVQQYIIKGVRVVRKMGARFLMGLESGRRFASWLESGEETNIVNAHEIVDNLSKGKSNKQKYSYLLQTYLFISSSIENWWLLCTAIHDLYVVLCCLCFVCLRSLSCSAHLARIWIDNSWLLLRFSLTFILSKFLQEINFNTLYMYITVVRKRRMVLFNNLIYEK